VAEDALETLTATLALALSKRMKASAMLPERYEALIDQGMIEPPELELGPTLGPAQGQGYRDSAGRRLQCSAGEIGAALGKKANLRYQPQEGIWSPNAT
jgi:hypothetical protein